MNGETKILSMLEILVEDVGDLKCGQKRIEQSQEIMRGDITSLKEDVTTLKKDVIILKEDVTTLKEDVTILKEDVTTL
ncbi:MAG: hypothetical protein LBR47_07425, partial [Spirochaetaceae bacterium]|nr:hypothetical protein [Spirochaetaceae bacterium]